MNWQNGGLDAEAVAGTTEESAGDET